MPTYTYVCKNCGHKYDKFQTITSQPDTICPKCNGTVERMIGGGVGIVFKGSGFYVTDYKKDSKGSSKEGNTESKSETKKEKTETKASA